MRSKNNGYVVATVILILSLVGFAFFLTTARAGDSGTLPEEERAILSNYSKYLETGYSNREANYSTQMDQLVTERQLFYREFFSKGLRSNLISLESQFITDEGVTITQTEDAYYVNIVEKITFHGKPIITSPNDFPLIQAAKWAMNQTVDINVRERLNQYITSMIIGVERSADEGVTIVFLINHTIEIIIENGLVTLLKDTFSDKSIDNGEGFDNVSWSGNQFTRLEPDWQKMLDYQMYDMPIEVIGEYLLKDFEAANETDIMSFTDSSGNSQINRDKAVWYIRRYTSNPTPMYQCQDGTLVLRFTAFYNASYTYLWDELECYDCTDYVSQALHYGGFPTDSTWKPELTNLAWIRVSNFMSYFSDPVKNRGVWASSLASLTPGDVVFIYDGYYADPWRHVVMYSSVNPSGYSAHTNDRLDYPFSPVFNRFLAINYYPSIFLHLIFNNSSNDSFVEGLQATPEFNPYTAP